MDYRERWELKDYLIGKLLERRIQLFHAGLFLLLLGFLLNFWYLQGVRGAEYHELAENNRLRQIPLHPTRGVIFDRHRQVLASTRPSLTLLLRRQGARDVEAQLRRLAGVLGTSYDELAERLIAMRGRPLFEPLVLKEDVSLEELARIEARRERFPSVEVQETARRSYPHQGMFAHSLGFVGEVSLSELSGSSGEALLASGDIVGKAGVERTYDRRLRGRRGWKVVSVNSLGRRIGSARVGLQPIHGHDLELTLDLRLQRALIEGLGDEAGAGVFLNPWTGEVLALASTPSFDPNRFVDGMSHDDWRAISDDPARPLHDRGIASFYAPGSTFKVLLAIAGLETGVAPLKETIYCKGWTTIYGSRRLCWKRGGHGEVGLRKALAQSCNVYFYHLGQQLGIEPIHHYGAMFNLGRPTGIDIPGEEQGILPSDEWKRRVHRERWYPGDTISVAIGQGLLAVTPVQIATMMAGVATGELPRPHVLRETSPEVRRLTISDRTLRLVRRYRHCPDEQVQVFPRITERHLPTHKGFDVGARDVLGFGQHIDRCTVFFEPFTVGILGCNPVDDLVRLNYSLLLEIDKEHPPRFEP